MEDRRDGYFDLQRTLRSGAEPRDLANVRTIQSTQLDTLASAINEEIIRWLTPYPSFLLNRVRSLSAVYAAMCPDVEAGILATAMKLPVLLFAIDDVVDGTRVVPRDDEADSLLMVCRDLALAGGDLDLPSRLASLEPELSQSVVSPWKDASQAFKRYCDELRTLPRAAMHYSFFAEMFAGCMNGMRNELFARRAHIETGAVPDYESYLASGKFSSGAPALYAAALLALAPEIDLSRPHEYSPIVEEFVLMGGTCIRLANDVRSFARETEIEQRPTSMLILMRTQGMSEQDAERLVISQADACLAAMPPLAGKLPAALHPWARAAERFTSLIRDWYMVRELHE